MVVSLHTGLRYVLFESRPVGPEVVTPHLPEPLSPDTHDGRAWLSVVALANADVRPAWSPRGIGLRFPQLNLRTYVTHGGQPGVYFLSLDAGGVLGVLGGRLLHRLPYHYARIDLDATGDRVRFESRRRHPGARPARYVATYGPTGGRLAAERGSLAAFLTDRYRYYTEAPGGELRYGAIVHDPWPLYRAEAEVEANTLFRASGFDRPGAEPVRHYSPGVDAVVAPGRRVR